MTQSKKKDNTITVDVGDYSVNLGEKVIENITIDLGKTYGTSTTYWAGDSITDVTLSDSNSGILTISATDEVSYDNITWNLTGEDSIWPSEVEKMCKQYPALEKVWRNFKSVYDMVQQDFEGKKKAGEIDDDIPF